MRTQIKPCSNTTARATAVVQEEHSPMLCGPLGELAPVVAALVRVTPAFGQRLLLASPAAFHAYVIHLHALPPEWRDDPGATARHMLETSPRSLLQAAMPEAPATLWRALRRLEPRAFDPVIYRRIAELLETRMADAVLAAPKLDMEQVCNLLEMHELDPLVIAAHGALGGDLTRAFALDTCIKLLRRHDMLEPDEVAARVLRKVGPAGLWHFVRRRLLDAKAPPFPVPLSPPLRALTTVRELVETGRRFGNCLAKEPRYMLDLVTGRQHFVVMESDPPVIAAVEIYNSGLFAIDHAEGPGGVKVSRLLVVSIIRALERAGLSTVLPGTLDALESLKGRPPGEEE